MSDVLQPWWTEDAGTRCDVEDMAAVAARFGVRRKHVPHIAVYPRLRGHAGLL